MRAFWRAVLLLTGFVSAAPADTIVLRAGPPRQASLHSCDEDVCRIDRRNVPRGEIAAILFDAAKTAISDHDRRLIVAAAREVQKQVTGAHAAAQNAARDVQSIGDEVKRLPKPEIPAPRPKT